MDDATPIFMYALPVLTVLAVGMLGSTRRIGFWGGVILSVLLTPIGGLLIALVVGPKRIGPPPKAKGASPEQADGKDAAQKKKRWWSRSRE